MGVFDYLPSDRIGKRYKPKPDSPMEVMRRWPSLTAHLICESLGYATPTKAGLIILDAINNRENWCEWVYACYNKNPKIPLQRAIKGRHHHEGYMAEYRNAIALVRRAIDTGEEPVFASWF